MADPEHHAHRHPPRPAGDPTGNPAEDPAEDPAGDGVPRGPSRRRVLGGLASTGVALSAHTLMVPPASGASRSRVRPNVIVILADDLGPEELGCDGNTFNETPNLDALARGGLRFTQAYSAAPICSPTRAGLLTGQYPARTGVTDFLAAEGAPSHRYLDPRLPTLPRRLADAGYTSALIGKWHLTEDYSGPYAQRDGSPLQHGFGEVRLSETRYIGPGDYFHPYAFMPGVPARWENEYLTDRLTAETVDFITAHAEEPFFLYLSHYAVHTQFAAKPDKVEKYRNKPGAGQHDNDPVLAAMLESIDDGVGTIMRTLERLTLDDSTLVVFASDNGPDVEKGSLRGQKASLYEGGIRVPTIAHLPGLIAAGRTSDAPVHTADLYPTALELAQVPADPGATVDGRSLVPLLRGEEAGPYHRRPLFWLFPEFNPAHDVVPQAAVRLGDHKLVRYLRDGRTELYDLRADPAESRDRSRHDVATRERLHRLLRTHMARLRVPVPAPEPAHYPVPAFQDDFTEGNRYTVLAAEPLGHGGDPVWRDGRLRVTAGGEHHTLFRSGGAPHPRSAAVLRIHSFSGPGAGPDRVSVGLIKDAANYVLVWQDGRRHAIGWDVVRDGRVTSGSRVTGNRPAMLDGLVDLSRPGSRYAFVLDGGAFTAYADPGSGWQFLITADVAGLVDLADEAVLTGYRYGFGVHGGTGEIVLDGFEARRTDSGDGRPG